MAGRALDLLQSLFARSREARWALASQVVTSGANFATTLILVRSLGLEGFGQFSVCFLLTMVVRNFLTATVLTPMSTIGPRLRPAALPAYRGFLAANALAFSLGSSALLLIAAAPLGLILDAPWLPGIALATAAANLTGNLADFLRRYHFVYEAPARAFLVDASRFTAQIGGLLLLPTLTGAATPETALLVLAAAGLVGTCIGAATYAPLRHHRPLWQTTWPRHWNFIKWMTWAEVPEALQANLPYFVAAALIDESQIGIIRALQSVANLSNLPLNTLQAIAPGLASRAYVSKGQAEAKRAVGHMLTTWSALTLLMSVATLAIARPMFGALFQLELDEGRMLVLLLFLGLNQVLLLRFGSSIFLQTLERPAIILAATGAGAVACVMLTPILISWFGAVGVPASLLAATLLIVAINVMAGSRITASVPEGTSGA